MSVPFLIAAIISLAFGGPLIGILAARKARQPISGDAPETHQLKAGTPTMGGLLILVAVILSCLICLALMPNVDASIRLRLLALLGLFALSSGIGILDDLGKARRKLNKAGLSERAKLIMQIVVSAIFLVAVALTSPGTVTTSIHAFGHDFGLGWWYYLLALLFICGFGNAVNFTDGLDGLASTVTLIATIALGLLPSLVPEVGIFYGALAGASAGFLWFNAHPAKVFMGDTGSLAIGMGLAGAAILAKQELLLFVVGGVYVIEIISMMLQRYVFKYRRITKGIEYARANRVFRRAPLHHHFEEMGWPETQVVARFAILGLLFAFVAFLVKNFLTSVAQ